MNYQRIYNQLIANRKNNPLPKTTYTEKHHIVPKSHGGSNSKDNLVSLSAREHFIAHWLLWRIYRDSSMAFAFYSMRRGNKTTIQYDKKYYSSFGYEEGRKAHSKHIALVHKGKSYCLGHKLTEEHKRKTSDGNRGQKRSSESRDRMSKAQKGRTFSNDTKNKMRVAKLGKKLSEEHKNKISEAGKKRIQTYTTKQKLKTIKTDKTLYTFVHKNGEIRIDCKSNMVEEFGRHIYSVVSGVRNICKGWSLVAKSH